MLAISDYLNVMRKEEEADEEEEGGLGAAEEEGAMERSPFFTRFFFFFLPFSLTIAAWKWKIPAVAQSKGEKDGRGALGKRLRMAACSYLSGC